MTTDQVIKVSKDNTLNQLLVSVHVGDVEIARASFYLGRDKHIATNTLFVEPAYRRQGVATSMYLHLNSLGYTILRTTKLTPDAEAFSESIRGAGLVDDKFPAFRDALGIPIPGKVK